MTMKVDAGIVSRMMRKASVASLDRTHSMAIK